MRVLIAYATRHGHTGLVAERIATVLREGGDDVDVYELHARGAWPDPSSYDAIVVGASVHVGHHQPQVIEWARRNATCLSLRPSAFFSVSLTAADDDPESVAAVRELIDDVRHDTGWDPDLTQPIAGALQYREYDLPTRVLMRLIARHHGGPTDAARDFVLTDWDAVDDFARRFAALTTAKA